MPVADFTRRKNVDRLIHMQPARKATLRFSLVKLSVITALSLFRNSLSSSG